jgi:hypothetical protein
MIRILGQLAIAAVAVAAGCDTGAASVSDAAGRRADERATSGPTDQQIWFALYSYQHEQARFISIDGNCQALYVEATSSNLETASVVRVARGRLAAGILHSLMDAVRTFERIDPAALAAMRPIEPVEQDGLLTDFATYADGNVSSWFGLSTKAMPARVSEALSQVAFAASKLDPQRPPSLVQATAVDAARAERIRTDPRKIYAFVTVERKQLDSSPNLRAAFRCLGSVVETSESEDLLVRDWLRRSNPRHMGETLFVEVQERTERRDYQVHVREVRPTP